MSVNPKNIDDMSEEEINAALRSELNEIDGNASIETENPPEPENKKEGSVEEKKETAPPETKNPSQSEDGDEDPSNPYRKRINRLLRRVDDTEARAEEETSARLKTEEELKKAQEEIARLKSQTQKSEEREDYEESDFKPTEESIKKAINDALSQRDMAQRVEAEKTQATKVELNELYQRFPEAIKREQELIKMSHRYPSLTFEALDTLLAPHDHIDQVEIERENAMRMDPGANSRADLESDVDKSKMTTAEMEAYLKKEASEGRLIV